VVYNPDADPDLIHEQALSLYVDDDEVVALYQFPAQAILHFLGYGPFKRSYIFEGPSNGGKTTYLVDFLNAIFGAENISNVSLQRIGTDRFVAGDIENAVINRCDDLSDLPLENVGPFKALTGGFSHNIERKFKTPYRGRITAVHAFSANMPPTVPDNILFDSAFWGRFVYLRFNNSFEVDPSFVSRVFTLENISGAFNRILETAFEIRTTGRLVYEQDPGEVKDTWQSASNPFERFVEAEMQPTQTPTFFDKSQLFRAFLSWCDEKKINPRKLPSSLTGFTKMIFASGFTTARKGSKKDREWMYEGRYTWKPSSKYREMI
jgi:phage/plasmid-associated DNA primase